MTHSTHDFPQLMLFKKNSNDTQMSLYNCIEDYTVDFRNLHIWGSIPFLPEQNGLSHMNSLLLLSECFCNSWRGVSSVSRKLSAFTQTALLSGFSCCGQELQEGCPFACLMEMIYADGFGLKILVVLTLHSEMKRECWLCRKEIRSLIHIIKPQHILQLCTSHLR